MDKDFMVDLSELPVEIPHAQLGTPLPAEAVMALSEEEHEALNALFDQAEALLSKKVPLTPESYTTLAQRYKRVTEMGLGHYCFVIQIGAMFRFDSDAEQIAQKAVAGFCDACH